jgi:hypothetical protein
MTPTSIALAQRLEAGPSRPAVLVGRQGAELVWQALGSPRLLRHLTLGEDGSVATLAPELRRVVTLGTFNGASRGLVLWNDRNLSAEDIGKLSERLGVPISTGHSLSTMGIQVAPRALNGASETASSEAFLPAVAVALTAGAREPALIDFLHPRLAIPKPARFSTRVRLLTLASILLVLLVGGLYWKTRDAEATALALEAKLLEQQPQLKAARAGLERFSYGRGFFQTRPPALDCLRELTLALRPDEPIWVTNFTFREDGRGQLQGRAESLSLIETLRTRLMANARFDQVQSADIRQGTGSQGGYSFTILFVFQGGR